MSTSSPLRSLPDVAHDPAALARPIDWVGMDGIDLPVRIANGDDDVMQTPARVDVAVDLADAGARGIHMSRLYLQLQSALAEQTLTATVLRRLLRELVQSQRGAASRARLRVGCDRLMSRPALASGNCGWKRYPLRVEAQSQGEQAQVALELAVEYSSTCPASAALARQLNAERFGTDFADLPAPRVDQVCQWLASPRGLAGTPHAQRSVARCRLELSDEVDVLPWADAIERIERALETPVQTAVKREDEQAFAALNAANLMFCEDAARRVAAALAMAPGVVRYQATVRHLESLHPHDAVASISGRGIAT